MADSLEVKVAKAVHRQMEIIADESPLPWGKLPVIERRDYLQIASAVCGVFERHKARARPAEYQGK